MPTVSAIAIVARGASSTRAFKDYALASLGRASSRAVVMRQRSLTSGTVGRGGPGVSLSVRIVAVGTELDAGCVALTSGGLAERRPDLLVSALIKRGAKRAFRVVTVGGSRRSASTAGTEVEAH